MWLLLCPSCLSSANPSPSSPKNRESWWELRQSFLNIWDRFIIVFCISPGSTEGRQPAVSPEGCELVITAGGMFAQNCAWDCFWTGKVGAQFSLVFFVYTGRLSMLVLTKPINNKNKTNSHKFAVDILYCTDYYKNNNNNVCSNPKLLLFWG